VPGQRLSSSTERTIYGLNFHSKSKRLGRIQMDQYF
jgi:hypothetical protein